MPLSDHEQRMLEQIESALYAEDPKFASSVRGGTLRAPTMRRRIQGVALFVVGLAMLVAGVPLRETVLDGFPIVSVVGFLAMFGGVILAITGPRAGRGSSGSGPGPRPSSGVARARAARSPAGWRTASGAASTNRPPSN